MDFQNDSITGGQLQAAAAKTAAAAAASSTLVSTALQVTIYTRLPEIERTTHKHFKLLGALGCLLGGLKKKVEETKEKYTIQNI